MTSQNKVQQSDVETGSLKLTTLSSKAGSRKRIIKEDPRRVLMVNEINAPILVGRVFDYRCESTGVK